MDYKAAAELLKKQDVFSFHRRPDGVTIGCGLGCAPPCGAGERLASLPNEDATSLFTLPGGAIWRRRAGDGFRGVGGYRGAEPVHAPGEANLARGIDLGSITTPPTEGFCPGELCGPRTGGLWRASTI